MKPVSKKWPKAQVAIAICGAIAACVFLCLNPGHASDHLSPLNILLALDALAVGVASAWIGSRSWQALRRANDQLQEQKEFLTRIVDHLPVALFCKDSSNSFKITLWNRTAEIMWGISRDQAVGRNDHDFFPRDQADFFRAKDLETLRNGQVVRIPEEPIDTKHGRQYLRTLKIPIPNSRGELQYLLGISEDITQQKRQSVLIEEQQVRLFTAAKLSSVGEMASGIAHEINNPLAVVNAKANQLKRLASDGSLDAAVAVQFADAIERHSHRIARIITSLRSLSRDGTNDPLVPVLLPGIVTDTLELCQHRLARYEVKLTCQEVPAVTILCRSVQIAQVLLNLINNAYDAVVNLSEKWIQLEFRDVGSSVEISVTDSGPGVPVAIREKIMQPFFTTKEVGKGTGLGLSISRQIIESHSGKLELDSRSPHTRFVITLPKA